MASERLAIASASELSGELGPPRSAVARTLALLRSVHDYGPVRADVLAREVGLPVSTVYRYLRALRDYELVSVEDGVYRAGAAFDDPPHQRVSRAEVTELAAPVLEQLVAATSETASLSIRVGTHAVCVHQVESPQAVRVAFRIGQILPLHAGASERVLLAYAPEQVMSAVLSGELAVFTSNTPNRSNLERKLRSTRAAGVATSRGEFTNGAIAVAAPVLCGGEIVCAIEVAGPDRRCGHEWQARAKHLMAHAVAGLGSLIADSRPRP